MKIAAITGDGQTIGQYLGRAAHCLEATIEDGQIVQHQLWDVHNQLHFTNHTHTEHRYGQLHRMDPASHCKHLHMAEVVTGCEARLYPGMGMVGNESAQGRGVRPVLADATNIDEKILAHVKGISSITRNVCTEQEDDLNGRKSNVAEGYTD